MTSGGVKRGETGAALDFRSFWQSVNTLQSSRPSPQRMGGKGGRSLCSWGGGSRHTSSRSIRALALGGVSLGPGDRGRLLGATTMPASSSDTARALRGCSQDWSRPPCFLRSCFSRTRTPESSSTYRQLGQKTCTSKATASSTLTILDRSRTQVGVGERVSKSRCTPVPCSVGLRRRYTQGVSHPTTSLRQQVFIQAAHSRRRRRAHRKHACVLVGAGRGIGRSLLKSASGLTLS